MPYLKGIGARIGRTTAFPDSRDRLTASPLAWDRRTM